MEIMDAPCAPSAIPYEPEYLCRRLLACDQPLLLLYGEAGTGKSTLVSRLADALQAQGRQCYCLNCDPGSPAFGPPGAVSLAERKAQTWQLQDLEPLCSLDAVRYRLPLINALMQLVSRGFSQRDWESNNAVWMVDAPGVITGAAGEELLAALMAQLPLTHLCYLSQTVEPRLASLLTPRKRLEITLMQPSPEAAHASKSQRTQWRTQAWRTFMASAKKACLPLSSLARMGLGGELMTPDSWRGRQCALFQATRWLAMGEVEVLRGEQLQLSLRYREPETDARAADHLLVRDAVLSDSGRLHTQHFRPATDVAAMGAASRAANYRGYKPRAAAHRRAGECAFGFGDGHTDQRHFW